MKKLLSLILCGIFVQSGVLAELKLEEVTAPQDPVYRLGTTDTPEIKSDFNIEPVVQPVIQKEVTVKDAHDITYADLSIKRMSAEISKLLEMDYNDMQSDLSLLWQGAAMGSDTIKFAIYKLSNPDKDKPDTSAVKKVLTTIAGMSTLVGAGMGNPVLASSALIGGNTLGIMSQDTKALNYKYTQVTDADMILLVRKVEELQQRVVDTYYEYITARELYNMTTEMAKRAEQNYNAAQKSSKEVVLMTDTFYREALDAQQNARGNFFEKRSRLEQLVGEETFRDFEQNLDKREKH
jgi:Outer membrane protein